MVGKVVINRDATDGAPHFHAAADVLETPQRVGRNGGWHADMFGCGDGGQRIELVVDPAELPCHRAHVIAVADHIKPARFAMGLKIADGRPEAADLAPATLAQHAGQAFFQSVDHDAPGGWDGSQQMMELPFDSGKIREDVRVIELQIVQNGGSGPIVDELAALVEKCGVVLVGFDDERGPPRSAAARVAAPRGC
jgi:hypothetical protein